MHQKVLTNNTKWLVVWLLFGWIVLVLPCNFHKNVNVPKSCFFGTLKPSRNRVGIWEIGWIQKPLVSMKSENDQLIWSQRSWYEDGLRRDPFYNFTIEETTPLTWLFLPLFRGITLWRHCWHCTLQPRHAASRNVLLFTKSCKQVVKNPWLRLVRDHQGHDRPSDSVSSCTVKVLLSYYHDDSPRRATGRGSRTVEHPY